MPGPRRRGKDPITAHGITDALRSAELLADAAAEGSGAALACYAALRDDLSMPLFEATDAIAACACPDETPGAGLPLMGTAR